MPIKFNSFPYLVRKEIINLMCNQELLIFSFCSLKTRQFAMNHFTRRDVKIIRYLFHSTKFVVQTVDMDEIEEYILTGLSTERLIRRKSVVIGEFQKPIFFALNTEEEPHRAYLICNIRHWKRMCQAVFDHLSALFRHSSPKISISFNSVTEFENAIEMPGLACTMLGGGTVDAKMLDEHSETYPKQMSALLDTEITGQFGENSEFLEVSTIHSMKSSPVSLFKLFRGRDLRLFNFKFDTNDVVEFLEKWITGVSYQNLELLYLFSPVSLNIDKRAIIQQFGLERWPENTPYMFEFMPSGDPVKKSDKLVYDCRRYYQVERESDHKLAAIKVRGNDILFFVFQ
ncbi:unnamed protein product [Caenorhabditis brenneri]